MTILAKEAWQIAELVNRKEIQAADVANECVDAIDAGNPTLNTHIGWDKTKILDDVSRQLADLDKSLGKGQSLPLAGVPIVLKDNIMRKGAVASCASMMLKDYRSPYDASIVGKLRNAGAIFVGRSNMDEFAMGSTNENSFFGAVKNPNSHDHVSGGSSGGSAASVAAGFVPLAIGTDTGGSIRQPASFCGVVGMKPSYGSVSRYGLISYASSFDQIGPISRTVRDAARLYDTLAGHDPKDSSSINRDHQAIEANLGQTSGLKGKKIGLIKECFTDGLSADVRGKLETAVTQFKSLGADIVDVSIPSISFGVSVYYILTSSEASSNLARYDGIRYGFRGQDSNLQELYRLSRSEGFGREVKKRIMLGTYALSSGYYDAYYQKATRLRERMKREVSECFDKTDLLLLPTAPQAAFKLDQLKHDPMSMYLSDVYTIIANLAEIPAISLPCGADSKGLPIGLQLMAPKFCEDTLFNGAYCYEQSGK